MSAGGDHACAFRDSALFCWGNDGDGAVGAGIPGQDMPPVAVGTSGVLSGITLTEVSAGLHHTCALSSAGRAYCWGDNTYGQLGIGASGTGTARTTPVAVETTGGALSGVTLVGISAGAEHTCAVSAAGGVFCWGANGSGQLGDGTAVQRDVPVAVDVAGLSGAVLTGVAAGGEHSCAVSAAGGVFCWGANGSGQLGDGTTEQRDVPGAVDVAGLSGAVLTGVAAGGEHSCAVSAAGGVFCWGANGSGQLGDGTTAQRHSPVAVDLGGALSGVSLEAVAAGSGYSCALSTEDMAYCWGDGAGGRLGDGTGEDQHSPAPVRPGPPSSVAATAADSGLDVSWIAPLGLYGGTLLRYTATASPGGEICTSTADTGCHIDGLDNGTPYSVSVVAETTVGNSVPAVAAEQATPVALPGPPTRVTVAAGDGEVFVSWTAPAVQGSGTLTGYTAFAFPNGDSCSSTVETQCTIEGLTDGIGYLVVVVAHSSIGDSPASDPSSPVVPRLPDVLLPLAVPPANGYLASSAGTRFTENRRTTTLTGDGFAPGSSVLVGIYSSGPRRLAAATADRSGRLRVRITIPDWYEGRHTLVAVGLAPSHRQRALILPITITSDRDLADTGSSWAIAIAVVGTGLVAAGTVALFCARRRSPRSRCRCGATPHARAV